MNNGKQLEYKGTMFNHFGPTPGKEILAYMCYSLLLFTQGYKWYLAIGSNGNAGTPTVGTYQVMGGIFPRTENELMIEK